MNDMTTAEQLAFIRKVTMYVLWRVATTDPEQGPTDTDPDFQKGLPIRGYSEAERNTIQSHAESLFGDDTWIADVVGTFAANYVLRDQRASIDWSAFESATKDGGV